MRWVCNSVTLCKLVPIFLLSERVHRKKTARWVKQLNVYCRSLRAPLLSKLNWYVCINIRLFLWLKWLQQLHLDLVKSQCVENSRHTIRLCRRILYHYRKEIWSLSPLSFSSHPLHCSLYSLKGVKNSAGNDHASDRTFKPWCLAWAAI